MGKSYLKENALRKLSAGFKKFGKVLEDNNYDYAFVRGELYSASSGNICMQFVIINEGGNILGTNLEYDSEEDCLFTPNNLHFKNESQVCNAIYNLVCLIETMQIPISRVYFEICQDFYKGTAEEDPKELGSYILYLLRKPSEHNMGICKSSASGVDKNLFGKKWE